MADHVSPVPPLVFRLTVGEVARLSGVAGSAVRFYERFGVITAQRTQGDQRRFNDNAACRIKVARVAQRVGLTVREIADLFTALPDDPLPRDWQRVAVALVSEAETRTEALRACLDDLGSGARLCDLRNEHSLGERGSVDEPDV